MALIVRESNGGGSNFEPAPEGTHIARCYAVIDIGHQYNDKYENWQHRLYISWELPTELREDGTPFVISKRYTASLSDRATLRHDLEAWRGKKFTKDELLGFELKNIIGKPCMINIAHTERGDRKYADVAAIMCLPNGTVCPSAINEPQLFDIPMEKNGDVIAAQWDDEGFKKLSTGLQGVIQKSRQFQQYEELMNMAYERADAVDEDLEAIPF